MQYLLLAHGDESAWQTMSKEQQAQGIAAFGAYVEALTSAGALVGNYRPELSTATRTVRFADGAAQVADGPRVEGSEQLTGVYVIEASDLDQAVAWAERNPAARFGVVEVRPVSAPRP